MSFGFCVGGKVRPLLHCSTANRTEGIVRTRTIYRAACRARASQVVAVQVCYAHTRSHRDALRAKVIILGRDTVSPQ
jgi:hypothetical protein